LPAPGMFLCMASRIHSLFNMVFKLTGGQL
jgi:hypothetical protein